MAQVDDQLTVASPEPESKFYTVKSGDNLSKISKAFYGDANQYNKIFEANRPLLKDADDIFPGQSTYSSLSPKVEEKAHEAPFLFESGMLIECLATYFHNSMLTEHT